MPTRRRSSSSRELSWHATLSVLDAIRARVGVSADYAAKAASDEAVAAVQQDVEIPVLDAVREVAYDAD